MKLINAADLMFKSDAELIALIREVTESLRDLEVHSPEYAATVSSLYIIKRALATRRTHVPRF